MDYILVVEIPVVVSCGRSDPRHPGRGGAGRPVRDRRPGDAAPRRARAGTDAAPGPACRGDEAGGRAAAALRHVGRPDLAVALPYRRALVRLGDGPRAGL